MIKIENQKGFKNKKKINNFQKLRILELLLIKISEKRRILELLLITIEKPQMINLTSNHFKVK